MKYKNIIKLRLPEIQLRAVKNHKIKEKRKKKQNSEGKNMKKIPVAKDSDASPTACPILLPSFTFMWCTLFSVTRL
jgi:hypothetical protein